MLLNFIMLNSAFMFSFVTGNFVMDIGILFLC